MIDIVNPPRRRWPGTAALVLAVIAVVGNLITAVPLGGLLAVCGIDVLPVQSRPEPASAAQVEAVAEVTLPPGTVLLSAVYSNGVETMLSAKLRLPRDGPAPARRHHLAARAEQIAAVLRDARLTQPDLVAGGYAASVRAQAAILTVLNTQIAVLQEQVKANFGEQPDVRRCI